MREVVLDTETTGLNIADGDRVIEIGCVEVVNRVRTGKYFHTYLKVDKESSAGALNVHGLTKEFLADKPEFKDIKQEYLDFLADSPLVIHNAKFDLGFLNNEHKLHDLRPIKNQIVDTLIYARKKFPGSPANLDALCKRFNIDATKRVKHGALLDAELLADVYLELTGGSQIKLSLEQQRSKQPKAANIIKIDFPERKFENSAAELAAHQNMLSKIKDNLWQ